MKRALPLLLLLAAGCGRKQTPLEVFGEVPGFTLTSHRGSPFDAAKELRGRIWVANFIFTNCAGPCPRMSSQMRQVQDGTAGSADVRMVSFTVDPARDTPEVLAAYAQRNKAGERWTFLTGTLESLHQLKRHVFLLGNVDGQLNHSTRFVLVDKQMRLRGFYDTSEASSIRQLIADIGRLEKES